MRARNQAIGWNQVQQVARDHEVWVITRSNNRQDIDAFLALESLPNVHWIYFDLPRWASFWKKGMRGMRTYYHCWQLGAYLKARRLHRRMQFDLAHHVTFVKLLDADLSCPCYQCHSCGVQ